MKAYALSTAALATLIAAFNSPGKNIQSFVDEQKEFFGEGYMSEAFDICNGLDDGIPQGLTEVIGNAFGAGIWYLGFDFLPMFPMVCDIVQGNVYFHIYLHIEGDDAEWHFSKEGHSNSIRLRPGTCFATEADGNRSWIAPSDFTSVKNAGKVALYIAAAIPEASFEGALKRLTSNIYDSELHHKLGGGACTIERVYPSGK